MVFLAPLIAQQMALRTTMMATQTTLRIASRSGRPSVAATERARKARAAAATNHFDGLAALEPSSESVKADAPVIDSSAWTGRKA